MKSAPAAILLLFAAAGSASATGTISCADAAGTVSVELVVGSVPGLAIVGGLIEADGRRLGVNREGVEPITVSQAFATADQIWVDFADGNVNGRVGELRLFRADEERHSAMAGTLRIVEAGAWAVACQGS